MAGIDFGKVGNILGAAGAGLSGNLPQFQRAQQLRQQQTLEAERQRGKDDLARLKTIYTDSLSGLNFANDGRWDLVQQLVGTRDNLLKQIPGVNGDDTAKFKRLIDAAAGGDVKAQGFALKTLQNNVDIGRGLVIDGEPILPPEAGPKIIPAAQLGKTPEGQFLIERLADGTIRKTKVLESAKVSDGGKFSAVTKFWDNGTSIQAGPSGTTIVKNPAGDIVTGQKREAVLERARQEQVDFAGKKKGAENKVQRINKLLDKLSPIRESISLIDEGIAALDSGASTGSIASLLPSVRASSKRLDNIQTRMGLNVVSNTTFGALSEGELRLALSSALPTNLSPPDLKQWLVDKRSVQEKLTNYITETATFLSTPGNSMVDWIATQKAVENQPPEDQTGGETDLGGGFTLIGVE